MREVLLRRLRGARAHEDRAAALALAERVARERGRWAGALQLGALAGRAVALGRDQEGPPGALRRLSGGHAVACGSGVLSLRLVLPGPAAWLDEPLPGLDRLPNRMVRGLLAALRSLGFDASYPGRDVVRARGASVAYLSCERDARGVCTVEAFVGVSASAAPEPLAVWPGGLVSPLASAAPLYAGAAAEAGEPLERVADAIAAAYARRHGLRFAPDPPDAQELAVQRAEAEAAPAEPEAALSLGPARAIPIGTLRAALRLGARGELAAVRFASEWIADSPGVAALARALQNSPLERGALTERAAPVLADPAHFFLGLDSVASVVACVLEAGAAARAGG